MEAYFAYLNDLLNTNKSEFGAYPHINWINRYKESEALEKRAELINSFSDSSLFKGTKLFHKQISKGCLMCGMGYWSCLFITSRCNAHCFYCPAAQLKDEKPESQGLLFPTADSYAEYINFFGFKGVSFSGGEPLLYFDRTLEYLKKVRSKCDNSIYIWLYTNGLLADEQKLKKLAKNGLNEIRFDIGATHFSLDHVHKAKGIIDNVTIEIPAVPEEKDKIISLLPDMIKAGVTNFNLHHMRLTHYNAPKLLKKNYSYLPAEHPLVFESELAALEILDYARSQNIELGINYCSFDFKNRFQKAGFRKQILHKLGKDDDYITDNGFIRKRNENELQYETIRLTEKGKTDGLGLMKEDLRLRFKDYDQIRMPVSSKMNIPTGKTIELEELLKRRNSPIPSDPLLFEIWKYEFIEEKLRQY